MSPTISASVIVLRGGQILLTQREDFEVWCLPSGHVEAGESLDDAARRETMEETGYDVVLDHFVGVYSIIGDWGDMHSCAFTGHVVGGPPGALLTPDEVVDVRWFDVDRLPDPMMWWHVGRIGDAVAGCHGAVHTQRIESRLGRLERADLYRARDESGMSRPDFFAWNFGTGASSAC